MKWKSLKTKGNREKEEEEEEETGDAKRNTILIINKEREK
jgi:hypothetical protein